MYYKGDNKLSKLAFDYYLQLSLFPESTTLKSLDNKQDRLMSLVIANSQPFGHSCLKALRSNNKFSILPNKHEILIPEREVVYQV